MSEDNQNIPADNNDDKLKLLFVLYAEGNEIHVDSVTGITGLKYVKNYDVEVVNYNFYDVTKKGLCSIKNEIIAYAIENNFETIIFANSNIGFTNRDIDNITRHNLPVVSALYPGQGLPVKVDFDFLEDHSDLFEDGASILNVRAAALKTRTDGLLEVSRVSEHFLCIKTKIFLHLQKFVDTYSPDGDILGSNKEDIPGIFSSFEKNGKLFFGMKGFCKLCGENNVPIYLDTGVILSNRSLGR